MHVHGVRAPAEVDVVREVDALLVAHLLSHLQLDEEVAPLRVQLAVGLLRAVQVLDEPRDVLARGDGAREHLRARGAEAQPVRRARPRRVGDVRARRHAGFPAAARPHLLHHPEHGVVDHPGGLPEHVQRVQDGLERGRRPYALRTALRGVQREHLLLRGAVQAVVAAHHDGLASEIPAGVKTRPRPRRRDHGHVPHRAQRRADHVLVVHEPVERLVPRDGAVLLALVESVVVVKRGNLEQVLREPPSAVAFAALAALAALAGPGNLDARRVEQQVGQRRAHLGPRRASPVRVVERGARELRHRAHGGEVAEGLGVDPREAVRQMRLGDEVLDVRHVLGQVSGSLPDGLTAFLSAWNFPIDLVAPAGRGRAALLLLHPRPLPEPREVHLRLHGFAQPLDDAHELAHAGLRRLGREGLLALHELADHDVQGDDREFIGVEHQQERSVVVPVHGRHLEANGFLLQRDGATQGLEKTL